MNNIATMEQLKLAIQEMEDQDYVNEQFMRRRVEKIVDDLRPVNLVKNMIRHVIKAPETKKSIFSLVTGTSLWRIAAGVATSLVVNKFFKKK